MTVEAIVGFYFNDKCILMDYSNYGILCIDDDPSILQALSFQLNKFIKPEDCLLEFFTNPEVALDTLDLLITKEKINILCIIVDYQMPKMSGVQFIRRVKEKHKSIKCIMLSGQANALQVDELVEDDLLDSFISKPWEEADLTDAVSPLIKSTHHNNIE